MNFRFSAAAIVAFLFAAQCVPRVAVAADEGVSVSQPMAAGAAAPTTMAAPAEAAMPTEAVAPAQPSAPGEANASVDATGSNGQAAAPADDASMQAVVDAVVMQCTAFFPKEVAAYQETVQARYKDLGVTEEGLATLRATPEYRKAFAEDLQQMQVPEAELRDACQRGLQ